jgi:hypothetical protein
VIERPVSRIVLEAATRAPVVVLTGPRQSGKSTICSSLFPDKPLVSLEDPDISDDRYEAPSTVPRTQSRYTSPAAAATSGGATTKQPPCGTGFSAARKLGMRMIHT